MSADDIDPITFEVIKNGLDAIADQMALVLMRTAYSPIVRDSLDFSTAVCDHRGRTVAQGLLTALHLGSFPFAMRNLVARHGGKMKAGDVFLFNDPYGSGGMHLPDIYLIKPVIEGGRVVGYATALVHHTDIGGITPGSIAVHATEIYQEGLRIPLVKLYDAGVPNETLLALIESNVRVPHKVMGDLRAQIASVERGEQGFRELLARYGAEELERYCDAMQIHAERAMRAQIAALPDGTYEFVDHIDGLGETPEPIRFQVKVTIDGDGAIVDWTGTSPQVAAAINAPGPFVHSACFIAFRCLAGRDIPNAEGYMRPIKVIAPLGTIVNPELPGAANARGITGFRAVDAVFGALAQAAPDRIPAAGEGGATNFGIGGRLNGAPYVFAETVMGAWGGRPDRDGLDGAANLAANQSNQPVEVIEADNPVEILQYGLVQNSGGPGRYRGGMALVRIYRFTGESGLTTFRTDRRLHPPYGLNGGAMGTPCWNILNPGPGQRVLPVLPMEGYRLVAGDVFAHVTAGAGGHGDPLARDPARVLEDLIDEKITPDYARQIYGVALSADGAAIDAAATAKLRRAHRRRAPGKLPHLAQFAKAVAARIGAMPLPSARKAP
jgi:N-methylhydantoinase B